MNLEIELKNQLYKYCGINVMLIKWETENYLVMCIRVSTSATHLLSIKFFT